MSNKIFFAQVETTTHYAIKAPSKEVAKELIHEDQHGKSYSVAELSTGNEIGLTDESIEHMADEVLILNHD